jgi:magnesium chelatase family protein
MLSTRISQNKSCQCSLHKTLLHTVMASKVYSATVVGVDAFEVEVEVHAGWGEEGKVAVVGLPDTAVRESKDRVLSAITNSALRWPRGKITVNLAPATVRKEGPSFDLPIALGMLKLSDENRIPDLSPYCLAGELALSGELRPVRGVLAIALEAKKHGRQILIVPKLNAEEAAPVQGLAAYGASSLSDGQQHVKRAVEVAAAGAHNLLMIGPPGSGKSMIAKRLPTILPPITMVEAIETTKIHSICGLLNGSRQFVTERPFRSPHHTVSDAGLLGGSAQPSPGEVSLAHNGVLFLDELPEFHRSTLEVLRQPLEDGKVTISRAAGSMTFPASFMLVAAMNPCPCGHYGNPRRECRCSPSQVQRYRSRLSGPLLDRIDLHIEVPAIEMNELTSTDEAEGSAAIRDRVRRARLVQQRRFAREGLIRNNGQMTTRLLKKHCRLDTDGIELIRGAVSNLNLSARAYDRILKVARTIADLAGADQITADHLGEAVQYRTLDRGLW